MIELTKLNHQLFIINSDLIETVEHTPNTVVTLTTGNKFVVTEDSQEIIDKIIAYKRKILQVVEG